MGRIMQRIVQKIVTGVPTTNGKIKLKSVKSFNIRLIDAALNPIPEKLKNNLLIAV